MSNKLCLGTVQFGMKYGINNAINRKPTNTEVFNVLDEAVKNDVRFFDTASVYGTAEEVLGEFGLSQQAVNIVSKLRPDVEASKVEKEIEESLSRLRAKYIDGYLLHAAKDFYRKDIMQALVKVKEKGFVHHIGVSIYEPEDALAVVNSGIIDYIQIPYNVLDKRLDQSDFFEICRKNKVVVFARSAFLQGLLLMNPATLPDKLSEARSLLENFANICKVYGFSRKEAAMLYSLSHPGIDYVVFGVDTVEQLLENVQISNKLKDFKDCFSRLKKEFIEVERKIIIPSMWQ